MNEELIVVCPTCETEIPARRARLMRVTCPGCGQRYEINYGGNQ